MCNMYICNYTYQLNYIQLVECIRGNLKLVLRGIFIHIRGTCTHEKFGSKQTLKYISREFCVSVTDSQLSSFTSFFLAQRYIDEEHRKPRTFETYTYFSVLGINYSTSNLN